MYIVPEATSSSPRLHSLFVITCSLMHECWYCFLWGWYVSSRIFYYLRWWLNHTFRCGVVLCKKYRTCDTCKRITSSTCPKYHTSHTLFTFKHVGKRQSKEAGCPFIKYHSNHWDLEGGWSICCDYERLCWIWDAYNYPLHQ